VIQGSEFYIRVTGYERGDEGFFELKVSFDPSLKIEAVIESTELPSAPTLPVSSPATSSSDSTIQSSSSSDEARYHSTSTCMYTYDLLRISSVVHEMTFVERTEERVVPLTPRETVVRVPPQPRYFGSASACTLHKVLIVTVLLLVYYI
jgi:hypothetical protein